MARQERYRRTDRPRRQPQQAAQPDPKLEQDAEQRARYGGFSTYMIVLLTLATIAAVVATVVFWPD